MTGPPADDNGNILEDIAPDAAKRVHLVGVAGTGMGAFASLRLTV